KLVDQGSEVVALVRREDAKDELEAIKGWCSLHQAGGVDTRYRPVRLDKNVGQIGPPSLEESIFESMTFREGFQSQGLWLGDLNSEFFVG
ncbi:unnamed protein product, partial [Ectocarpus sp. 12 AP-2014]